MNIQRKPEPVLFIAYRFPPVGGPGVNRSLNFVKYLSESGYKPIVITISDDDLKYSDYPLDPSLLDQLPKGTEIIRVASGEPRRLRAFLLKIKLFRFAWFFFYPLFWERSARWPSRVIPIAEKLILKRNIRLVYTSSGPFSSMIVGSRLKKRTRIKWVADLRDPFTDAYVWQFPGKLHWYFFRFMEKKIFKRADTLIVCTSEMRKLYIERGLLPLEKIKLIPNGF